MQQNYVNEWISCFDETTNINKLGKNCMNILGEADID